MATTLALSSVGSSTGPGSLAFDPVGEGPPVIPDDVLAPALFEFFRGNRWGSA